MNKILALSLVLLGFGCAHTPQNYPVDRMIAAKVSSPDALFCPNEGDIAFNRMYDLIGNARVYAHITAYSWSDSGLDRAVESALKNGAKVKMVLHPDLYKDSPKVQASVAALETKGAEVKIAPMNMHEKFSVIDDETVINTSANFSGGAKNKYSENVVYHELKKENSPEIQNLIDQFKREFAIIWNTGKDVVTNGEKIADQIQIKDLGKHFPNEKGVMELYSSSMNFDVAANKVGSAALALGKYFSLKKRTNTTKEQTWIVRDVLIKHINAATKSIQLSLNHFNIREVSDALIEAVKRGVDVKLAVDAQEYKSKPNDLEMSPQFAQDWYALKGKKVSPPIRVKYYSHEPNPATWSLNHHKFVLVDYGVPGKTVLLSGSYNLSKTAEQNQFDNLIVYKKDDYKDLYTAFNDEFKALWFWNRPNDVPKQEIIDQFLTAKGGAYPIHIQEAVSLSWEEIVKLRSDLTALAPGFFRGLNMKTGNCSFYDPKKNKYFGASPKCPR